MDSLLIALYSTHYNDVEVRLYPFGLGITHQSGNDRSLTVAQHDDMLALRNVNGWDKKLYVAAPEHEWERPVDADEYLHDGTKAA